MNFRLVAWLVGGAVALVLVGWLAVKIFFALLGWAIYLAIGAVVILGAVYGVKRIKKALADGSIRRSLPR
ncbi:hypothetical protein Afil01_47170 [Actinorhabdospora filicis]|uniref:Uncharacterized protein n=1 Tax=Actinorhabdospora filicis TaxID=1785913 RepID=A0A9W6WCL5_9ACTN|nr:hypothetical protein [Actinorhabdospora filicis]GLZ79910.1 hypothetical protein Afil01_47170 [Actinorhabdospora filicis]